MKTTTTSTVIKGIYSEHEAITSWVEVDPALTQSYESAGFDMLLIGERVLVANYDG